MVMFPRESFHIYGPPAVCQVARGSRAVLPNSNCLCPADVPYGEPEVRYKVLRAEVGKGGLEA